MKLIDLLDKLNVHLPYGADKDIEFSEIAECAEEVNANSILILIKRLNGEIAKYTYDDGQMPLAVICDESAIINCPYIPIIKVKNPRRALSFAYSLLYDINYDALKVIGVTGTNGKSTTASLIKKILEYAGHSVGFIGTGKIEIGDINTADVRYSMTTPDPRKLYSALADMQAYGCEFAVMEVSSHAIALEKTAPIIFHTALFTNLSPEHMDFHSDMEDYFETKLRLFENCRHAVFNIDDSYGKRASELFTGKKTTVGILNDADARAYEINDFGINGFEYIYSEKNFNFLMRQRLPGAFNVYNTMMATAASVVSGIKPCMARRSIAEINIIDGRCEIIKDEITVIIDYAHTPYALENILLFAKSLKNGKKKITTVFGCGGERDKKKRPKMAAVAEKYSDITIITSDNSRGEDVADIISDILCGVKNTDDVKIIPERASAVENAILASDIGDIVAVIGKGAERYNIDASGYHAFDERKIIKDSLAKRKRAKYENKA